jgi:hypothetical protein
VLLGVLIALVVAVFSPPPPVEAGPGQETFDAIRLTDGDLRSLGLTAGSGGRQPSTLATAALSAESKWTGAAGAPGECAFAGSWPGEPVFPLAGDESEATPLWREKVVSGTQTVFADDRPIAWVTFRTFESAEAAAQFVADDRDRVAACSELTFRDYTNDFTVSVADLDEIRRVELEHGGWVSTIADWVEPGRLSAESQDAQTWVLDMARGPVVGRVVLVAAESDAKGAWEALVFIGERVADSMTDGIAP